MLFWYNIILAVWQQKHCQWQLLEKLHKSYSLNVNSPAHSKFRAYYIVKMISLSVQGASFCYGEYKTFTSSEVMNMTGNEDCCNLELKCSCISECWHLQIGWFLYGNVFLCPDTWEGGPLEIRVGNWKHGRYYQVGGKWMMRIELFL